jgi:hypothetical protein
MLPRSPFRPLRAHLSGRTSLAILSPQFFSHSAIWQISKHDKSSGNQEGQAARTDSSVQFRHPDTVQSEPVRGHGGRHFKPTLASFSLEGKTAVVTGGARGLGLVMAQGMMTSGANIALMDINGKFRVIPS